VKPDEMFTVELRHLPLAVLNRATDHNLTLMRELALVHAADETGTAPARLLWLSHHLDDQYAAFNAEPRETLQRAIEGDQSHIDMTYEVPAHAAEAAAELGAALDEVDEYCRQGDLLTLVTPAEALAFRRWLLGEFVAQIRDGADPQPWSDELVAGSEPLTAQAPPDSNMVSNNGEATGRIVIEEDLDLEGAARLRGHFASLLDGGVVHLTVDLASCSFIDSVGISLLLTTRERLRQSHGSIVVINASGATRRTLETTGVYDILTKGT
jgi:anti-sigma B factor antagonist